MPEWSAVQLPVVIFLAEVCVVTISTLRIIAIARGQTLIAPLLGFFARFFARVTPARRLAALFARNISVTCG